MRGSKAWLSGLLHCFEALQLCSIPNPPNPPKDSPNSTLPVPKGLPLSFNPRVLYRGYTANCANVAAGTSFQFAMAGALNKLVLQGERRELRDAEKVGTGRELVAGGLAGLGKLM